MTTTLFVPLNDDLIEQYPEFLHERLIPYQTELPCYHALASEPRVADVTLPSREVCHVAVQ